MKLMAFEKIPVCDVRCLPDPKSYIAPGDWCKIRKRTVAGWWEIGYPTAKGEKVRYIKNLKGFLCNQNDYPGVRYPAPGYEGATIRTSGCGVCSAVNALGALKGIRLTVPQVTQLAQSCGARVSGGTNERVLLERLSRQYDLRFTTTDSLAQLQAHLQAGGVAICNVAGRGMFSTGGHFMAVPGMTDGKLLIADPGLYSGKYASAKRKAAVTVCGDLLLTRPETLDADCRGRSPKYYLLEENR